MKNLLFILLCIIQLACEKPFAPPSSEYEALLVVDGEITNAPRSYTAKILTSSVIQQDQYTLNEDAFNYCTHR